WTCSRFRTATRCRTPSGRLVDGVTARFRDARRGDLPAIVAIYNATVASRVVTADLEPVTVASKVPWFKAHSPDTYPLGAVEVGGAVAAWVSLTRYLERPAYAKTAEISVYVADAHRREGIGRAAVEHMLAAAPGLGLRTLLALVFGHNRPSLRLFE